MRLGAQSTQRLPLVVVEASLRCTLPIICAFLCITSGCSSSSSTPSLTPPPTGLAYPQTSISATVGTSILTDTPTVTGTVTSYSVAPALPPGLTFNSSTGAISGMPSAVAAQASYTVTASNSGGSTTATVVITVSPGPPSNLAYPRASIAAAVGTAIQPDIPTVTGTVTSYSVAPTLPAGLNLDTSTGAISGTPTTVTAQASYTVTASNPIGSTSTAVQISVNPPPPSNFVYPQMGIEATVGTAIQPDIPIVTGTVTGYSVVPALPPGLNLDTSTGEISGKPTTATTQAFYNVTASNSYGSVTISLLITVSLNVTPLLNLGQTAQILALQQTADRVLSIDSLGNWVLWNSTSGQMLNSGSDGSDRIRPCAYWTGEAAIAGSIAAVGTGNGAHVLSLTTGQVLFSIGNVSWWQLAPNGTYIAYGGSNGLWATSSEGVTESGSEGDYSAACPISENEQVQVANGPAGANVIQTVSVNDGSVSTSPAFPGTFYRWFTDGSHFITNGVSTSSIYANNVALENVVNGPVDGGYGNWAWSAAPSGVTVLPTLSASSGTTTFAAPAYSTISSFGSDIAFLNSAQSQPSQQVDVIDLSASVPSEAQYQTGLTSPTAIAVYSPSQWVAGDQYGRVLIEPAQQYLGYGRVLSMAGSENSLVASTAIGTLLFYNLNGPSGPALTSTAQLSANQMALSSDGSVLATLNPADNLVTVYSLPSMNTVSTFTAGAFAMSGSGNTIAQYQNDGMSVQVSVTGISGNPTYLTESYEAGSIPSGSAGAVTLSPDGTLIGYAYLASSDQYETQIYLNGNPVAVVPGVAEGWINNNQILVANYSYSPEAGIAYEGSSTVYSATGATIATVPLPLPIWNPQFTTPTTVYDPAPETDAIYSLTTGTLVWQGPLLAFTPGAACGSYICYVSGAELSLAAY